MRKSDSIEENIWDRIEPGSANVLKTLTKVAYGSIMLPLRIPTFTRRKIEHTDYLSRAIGEEKDNHRTLSLAMGIALGFWTGIAGFYFAGKEIVEATQSGNYWPLAAIGVTNLASGIYEAVRKKASNQNEENSLETQVTSS